MADNDSEWTPEEWRLPLSEALRAKKEGTGQSAQQAREALENRILLLMPGWVEEEGTGAAKFPNGSNTPFFTLGAADRNKVQDQAFAALIADAIVKGLGPEANVGDIEGGAIDVGIIKNLDLRPYLQLVREQPNRRFKTEQWGTDDRDAISQGRVNELITALDAEATRVAGAAAAEIGVTSEIGYSTSEVGVSPQGRLATVGQTAGAAQDPVAAAIATLNGGTSAEWENPTFDEGQWRQIAGMKQSVFDQIIDAEIDFNENAGTPGVMRTGIVLDGTGYPTGSSGQPVTRKLSLQGALGWLARQDAETVASMQEKMAAAGYFNQVGQNYIWGDADDEATYNAWQMVLLESYQQNVPVDQILVKKAAEARKIQRQQMLNTWGAPDANRIRTAANVMAADAIGRELRDDEFEKLQAYLTNLVEDRADDLTGADDTSWRNEYSISTGYSEDDIAAGLDPLLRPEMGASAGWDTIQKVWSAFDLAEPDAEYEQQWKANNKPRWMTMQEQNR